MKKYKYFSLFWKKVFVIILIIFLFTFVVSIFLQKSSIFVGDKIAVIPIEGKITIDHGGEVFMAFDQAKALDIIGSIEDAQKNDKIKGVIFEINSPGGTVVASEEIANEIKKLNKTNYAVVREIGASGAYWAASASDKIYASPVSITGSIGVISSYLQFSDLFDEYGIQYERLVTGEYKDLASPFKNLTPKERVKLQNKLNLIHEYFVKAVAENRGMDVDVVKELATGEFYLGSEAMDLGLIDEYGDVNKAFEDMKMQLDLEDVQLYRYKAKKSLLSSLVGVSAYQMGEGIGSVLLNDEFQIRT